MKFKDLIGKTITDVLIATWNYTKRMVSIESNIRSKFISLI
jgi:hypothetical protein